MICVATASRALIIIAVALLRGRNIWVKTAVLRSSIRCLETVARTTTRHFSHVTFFAAARRKKNVAHHFFAEKKK